MRELDTVVVNKDIPEHGIKQGDIGVIVHTYENKSAVEVEFVSGEGTTLGVITLLSEDVRLMKKDEILHVRELYTA
jgi:ATP-dependent exoDNAse (exonuclease V) alpha subunit